MNSSFAVVPSCSQEIIKAFYSTFYALCLIMENKSDAIKRIRVFPHIKITSFINHDRQSSHIHIPNRKKRLMHKSVGVSKKHL